MRSNTVLADLFESANDFENVLRDACDTTKTEAACDFLARLAVSYTRYGMQAFCSEKQYDWLLQLAGTGKSDNYWDHWYR